MARKKRPRKKKTSCSVIAFGTVEMAIDEALGDYNSTGEIDSIRFIATRTMKEIVGDCKLKLSKKEKSELDRKIEDTLDDAINESHGSNEGYYLYTRQKKKLIDDFIDENSWIWE